jgi:hypothetical protein
VATVRDVIKSGLRRINAYGDGEDLSDETADLALETVNYIFEQWTIDKLLSYQVVQENYALTINQQTYTIGSSGDFNTTRPADIQSAFIRFNSVDYPMVKLNDDDWNSIGTKDSTTTFPRYFYYRPAFPLGSISVYGKPTDNCTIYLNLTKVFSASTLDTVLSLPPGYTELLALDLAIRLAPIFAAVITDDIRKQQYEIRGKIMTLNSNVWQPISNFCLPGSVGGVYDVYSDTIISRGDL